MFFCLPASIFISPEVTFVAREKVNNPNFSVCYKDIVQFDVAMHPPFFIHMDESLTDCFNNFFESRLGLSQIAGNLSLQTGCSKIIHDEKPWSRFTSIRCNRMIFGCSIADPTLNSCLRTAFALWIFQCVRQQQFHGKGRRYAPLLRDFPDLSRRSACDAVLQFVAANDGLIIAHGSLLDISVID